MEGLPFLDEEPEQEEVAAPEVTAEAEPEQGEPQAAPPAGIVEEPKHIPISALLDEREKRQAAAREAEELRRELAALKAAQTPPKDFYENPEEALRQSSAATQAAVVQVKLDTSRFLAEEKYGKEKVDAAFAFFNENPHLSTPLLKHPSPFHEAVKVYERHQLAAQMGDDPQAWIEAQVQARLAQSVQPKPVAPPPSLASAAAAGGTKAPTKSGFEQLFGD